MVLLMEESAQRGLSGVAVESHTRKPDTNDNTKDQIAPATISKNSRSAQRTHPGALVPHGFLSQLQ